MKDKYESPIERREDSLTPEEVKGVRRLLQSAQNVKWFWATLRNITVYSLALLSAITLGYSTVVDAVKSIAGVK